MDSWLIIEKIFTIIFPLIAIVSIGYLYAKRTHTDMSMANQMNIDIFSPALIFSVLSAKSFDIFQFQTLAIGAAIVILGSGLLLWPICRLLQVQPKTFLPPMMFSNSGNLGIPLVVLSFGEQALPAAIVLFITCTVLHFSIGVLMLNQHANPLVIFKMPIIVATILGIIVSGLNWELPATLLMPIDLLGQISIPLMLFSLGVRMTQVDLSDWKIGVSGAILAPFSGLLLAWVFQRLFHLPSEQYAYLLLFSTLPPAVLNFILAERYQQEPPKVASIVLIGNLFAMMTIPLILFFIL